MNSPLANKLFQDVKKELYGILPYRYTVPHIEIKNLKSSLGRCHKIHDNYYQIQLSKYLLDCDTQFIKNVIAHELIHTINGCFNHGYNFQRYVNLINKLFPHYKIELRNTDKQFSQNIKYKYKITCLKCGSVFYRHRLYKHHDHLSHGQCGGKLKVEQLY